MKQILVIGPAWVGDMVLAQSVFKQLKIDQADCQIDVAAPPWTLPLLARMPEVRTAIALPFKHGELALRARWQLGRQLSATQYDQAILLTNHLKSAIVPWAANIPVRTGFKGEMRYGLVNDMRTLDKSLLKQTVQRFLALGRAATQPLPDPMPQPALVSYPERAASLYQRLNIPHHPQAVLALCPGAEYGEAKRWPAQHYAEVATYARAQGWQVWLFGSAKDQDVTAHIQAMTQHQCVDLAGKTTLTEVIDLMAVCDQVVSNDSGLMHIAAALNKPLLAIYGSSDPQHTPPMSPQAVIEYLGLSCSPCFQRSCPLNHLHCLQHITPERVISHLVLTHAKH